MKQRILVTGGAGYIGSHTVKKLIEAGYEIFVIDNLSTGNKNLLLSDGFCECDIADEEKVRGVIRKFKPDAVIHFAASKDAPESVADPRKYFENNVAKTIKLLGVLIDEGVKNIVFSSTAAVYGDVQKFPITEDFDTAPTNPYGQTKLIIEKVIEEYQKAGLLDAIVFRYFNAAGADPEGKLGNLYPEPKDVISMVIKAAKGDIPKFEIYGTDYDTKDGTCIRDIIHVEDLATAHVLGVKKLLEQAITGIFNLGSENGYTIREIADTTKRISGKDFTVADAPRREGDIIVSIASSEKAKKALGWEIKYGLNDIIETAWKWVNSPKH